MAWYRTGGLAGVLALGQGGIRVQQPFDPLAGRQLATGTVAARLLLATTLLHERVAVAEEIGLGTHRGGVDLELRRGAVEPRLKAGQRVDRAVRDDRRSIASCG
ncbi:MAG: hypothetical protein AB7R89_03630 [Dehalococcoidia bacterium]